MRELDLIDDVLFSYWNFSEGQNKILKKLRDCMASLLETMATIGVTDSIQIDKNVFVILYKALRAKNPTELGLTIEEREQFPILNNAFKNTTFVDALYSISILSNKSEIAREVVTRIQQVFSADCLGLMANKEMKIRKSHLIFSNLQEQQRVDEIKKSLIVEAEGASQEVRNLCKKYGI